MEEPLKEMLDEQFDDDIIRTEQNSDEEEEQKDNFVFQPPINKNYSKKIVPQNIKLGFQ